MPTASAASGAVSPFPPLLSVVIDNVMKRYGDAANCPGYLDSHIQSRYRAEAEAYRDVVDALVVVFDLPPVDWAAAVEEDRKHPFRHTYRTSLLKVNPDD